MTASPAAAAALLLAVMALAPAAIAQDAAPAAPSGPATLTATLVGDFVVPDDGDPDGKGTATFNFDPAKNTLCFDVDYRRVAPVTASHIHAGGEGKAGAAVVTLKLDPDEYIKGCTPVPAATVAVLLAAPGSYYVDVHTTELQGGAIRGQLGK